MSSVASPFLASNVDESDLARCELAAVVGVALFAVWSSSVAAFESHQLGPLRLLANVQRGDYGHAAACCLSLDNFFCPRIDLELETAHRGAI